MKIAPKRYQDGGKIKKPIDGDKTKKPIDYSKSVESNLTEKEILAKGYTKGADEKGQVKYYRQGQNDTPKAEVKIKRDVNTTPSQGKKPSISAPKLPYKHKDSSQPTNTDWQDVVHIKQTPPTPTPKAVGLNTDIEVRGERKNQISQDGKYYHLLFPDTKGGGGMSKATDLMFNNDSSRGAKDAHISGYDEKGNPIFSGKTAADFTPENMGSLSLMSNDVNKDSLDTQLSNSKNPVVTTGNKFQEKTAQGLNAPYIDKSSQGINVGLQDIEKLPSTKLRDTETITSPKFKKGGMVKCPKFKKGGKC